MLIPCGPVLRNGRRGSSVIHVRIGIHMAKEIGDRCEMLQFSRTNVCAVTRQFFVGEMTGGSFESGKRIVEQQDDQKQNDPHPP